MVLLAALAGQGQQTNGRGADAIERLPALVERHGVGVRLERYRGTATLEKGQFPRTDEILRQAVLAESDVDDIVTAVDKVATAIL